MPSRRHTPDYEFDQHGFRCDELGIDLTMPQVLVCERCYAPITDPSYWARVMFNAADAPVGIMVWHYYCTSWGELNRR